MTALERAVLYEFVQQWQAAHDNPQNMCDELIFSELPPIAPLEELLNGTTEHDDYLRGILVEREACAKVCDEWAKRMAHAIESRAAHGIDDPDEMSDLLFWTRTTYEDCARRIRRRK